MTVGPSSLNKKFLRFVQKKRDLISLVRINLSHVSYEKLLSNINYIRSYCSVPICIDTEGAQIRTKVDKKKFIKKNKIFFLYKSNDNFKLYPENVFRQIKIRDTLNIGFEGLIAKVIKKNEKFISLKCISAGLLENNKGVHLENREINLDFITPKDLKCIELAKKIELTTLHYPSRTAQKILKNSKNFYPLREESSK